jgi:hypothetical protein
MLERVIGVFRLDVATFEEIEHDRDATMQAAMVVLIISVITGLGTGIGAAIGDGSFFRAFFGSVVGALVGWIVWSAITYFVGTSMFEGEATLEEMLRVIGFAYVPQILGIIPCIGWLIGIIWSLIAGFIAVRQGLDLDNTKAFLTIVIGVIGYLIVMAVIGIFTGIGSAFLSIF